MVQDDDVSCIGIHDDFYDPSICEILNSLSMSQYEEWKTKGEITQKLFALNEKLLGIIQQYQMLSKEPDAIIQ